MQAWKQGSETQRLSLAILVSSEGKPSSGVLIKPDCNVLSSEYCHEVDIEHMIS